FEEVFAGRRVVRNVNVSARRQGIAAQEILGDGIARSKAKDGIVLAVENFDGHGVRSASVFVELQIEHVESEIDGLARMNSAGRTRGAQVAVGGPDILNL